MRFLLWRIEPSETNKSLILAEKPEMLSKIFEGEKYISEEKIEKIIEEIEKLKSSREGIIKS